MPPHARASCGNRPRQPAITTGSVQSPSQHGNERVLFGGRRCHSCADLRYRRAAGLRRNHARFRHAIDRARRRYVPGLVLAEVDDFLFLATNGKRRRRSPTISSAEAPRTWRRPSISWHVRRRLTGDTATGVLASSTRRSWCWLKISRAVASPAATFATLRRCDCRTGAHSSWFRPRESGQIVQRVAARGVDDSIGELHELRWHRTPIVSSAVTRAGWAIPARSPVADLAMSRHRLAVAVEDPRDVRIVPLPAACLLGESRLVDERGRHAVTASSAAVAPAARPNCVATRPQGRAPRHGPAW